MTNMQTMIEGRCAESLVRLDEELDSAIFLMDELYKYDSIADEESKSSLEEYGMRLVSLREKLKGFLGSEPAQPEGLLGSYVDSGR